MATEISNCSSQYSVGIGRDNTAAFCLLSISPTLVFIITELNIISEDLIAN